MKKIFLLRILFFLPLLVFIYTLLAPPASCKAAELSMEGYKEITAPELKELTDSGRDVLIINVLSKIEYDIQHVSGSINIPIVQMLTTTDLPEDKNIPLVFYCLSDR